MLPCINCRQWYKIVNDKISNTILSFQVETTIDSSTPSKDICNYLKNRPLAQLKDKGYNDPIQLLISKYRNKYIEYTINITAYVNKL